jgi:mycothiol synthase
MTTIPTRSDHAETTLSVAGHRLVRPGPDRLVEALEQLLALRGDVDRSHALRFVEHAGNSGISLDLIWSAEDRAGRLVASMLAVTNPGRTAMVFATSPHPGAGADLVGRLIHEACAGLDPTSIVLAQSLLDSSDALTRHAFELGGFSRLAMLAYMERHVPGRRDVVPVEWPPEMTPVAFDESRRESVVGVLDRSYLGTLDCPALCGLRQTSDILEGHRRTGRHDSGLWTMLLSQDRPVGVLLLNPAPASNSIELVYLGLDPDVRGRGLAGRLLRHGMNLVAGRPERTINLAVDEQNAPALALYRAAGFRTTLRRLAMIRPVPAHAS